MQTTQPPFILDPRLQADCAEVTDLKLSKLLLMNNQLVPWVILVPREANISEIIELSPKQQGVLLEEIDLTSRLLKDVFQPDKLNVAAIGNVVQQLHIHVIARYHDDVAWPKPVWGNLATQPYQPKALKQRIALIRDELKHVK